MTNKVSVLQGMIADEDTNGELVPGDLSKQELTSFGEHAEALGTMMADVFDRREQRPFNFDTGILMVNGERRLRIHVHLCVQEGTEADDELIAAATASSDGHTLQ